MQVVERAHQFSHRIAIRDKHQTYTYQALFDKASKIAHHLLGNQKDLQEARIAFLTEASFDYTAIQWGIWLAGAVAVPLCTLHPLPALEYVIDNAEASILIADEINYAKLSELATQKKIPLFLCSAFLKELEAKPLPFIEDSRRAMILYTSGTTNLPKGVVSTHSNINFQIESLVKAWQWQKEDHIVNVLPLHHVHGIINVMSSALWVGACCQFMPKFNPQKLWTIFKEGNVNLFMAVPTIYFKLIAFWDQSSTEEQNKMSKALQSFRLMISGSAALPVPVLEKWQKISGHTLLERYGMTEIGMAISNPYDSERRAGHIGQPLKGVQIRLCNQDEIVEKDDASGEIQIKGPNVFKEYWKKPEATAEAFTEDGWFRSGDIAVLNANYYKILGRDSVDIIKSGGYKISALEIEDVLRQHEAIIDAAVVGLSDPEWGEKVVACILIRKDVPFETDAVKSWLKQRLAVYKIPKHFIIRDKLPRNVLGKVTKKELRTWF